MTALILSTSKKEMSGVMTADALPGQHSAGPEEYIQPRMSVRLKMDSVVGHALESLSPPFTGGVVGI
jgi:hypothetical protein